MVTLELRDEVWVRVAEVKVVELLLREAGVLGDLCLHHGSLQRLLLLVIFFFVIFESIRFIELLLMLVDGFPLVLSHKLFHILDRRLPHLKRLWLTLHHRWWLGHPSRLNGSWHRGHHWLGHRHVANSSILHESLFSIWSLFLSRGLHEQVVLHHQVVSTTYRWFRLYFWLLLYLRSLRIKCHLLFVTLRRLLVGIIVPLTLLQKLLLPPFLARVLSRLKPITVDLIKLLVGLFFKLIFHFFRLYFRLCWFGELRWWF